ncbi:MAG: hypothetical protein WB706_01560 [Nitrososphaeraceae archaeon]
MGNLFTVCPILSYQSYLMVFGGESDKNTTMMARMTPDDKVTEPLTAKHISLFFLVSLGVELRRELRQQ